MLGNFEGYHVLILLAVIVVAITIVIVVAVLVHRRSSGRGDAVLGDPAGRIEQLMRLRDQGSLSEKKFKAKRLEILRGGLA